MKVATTGQRSNLRSSTRNRLRSGAATKPEPDGHQADDVDSVEGDEDSDVDMLGYGTQPDATEGEQGAAVTPEKPKKSNEEEDEVRNHVSEHSGQHDICSRASLLSYNCKSTTEEGECLFCAEFSGCCLDSL